jgi:hypothetical protein
MDRLDFRTKQRLLYFGIEAAPFRQRDPVQIPRARLTHYIAMGSVNEILFRSLMLV